MSEFIRISDTTIEVEGEIYVKNYGNDFEDDVLLTKDIVDVAINSFPYPPRREKQLIAISTLTKMSDYLNKNVEEDEKGFKYYVYYNKEHNEFFICEHQFSTRHIIYFKSRKLAQFTINNYRSVWEDFYLVNNK